MPVSKTTGRYRGVSQERSLRFEQQEEEETFLSKEEQRKSGIVTNPGLPTQTVTGVGVAPGRKGKRSMEEMMACMGDDYQQALYAMERIASAEDLIAKVLKLCTPKALDYVLEKRPSMKKYAPDNE